MKLKRIESSDGTCYVFYCKGCRETHSFQVPRWKFNGDMEFPTFWPSLRSSWQFQTKCHLYVTRGEIEYLGDCAHEFASKTIPLPEIPNELL